MSAFHCKSLNEFGKKTLRSLSEVREFLISVCLFLVKSLPFFTNAQKAFYINKKRFIVVQNLEIMVFQLRDRKFRHIKLQYWQNFLHPWVLIVPSNCQVLRIGLIIAIKM